MSVTYFLCRAVRSIIHDIFLVHCVENDIFTNLSNLSNLGLWVWHIFCAEQCAVSSMIYFMSTLLEMTFLYIFPVDWAVHGQFGYFCGTWLVSGSFCWTWFVVGPFWMLLDVGSSDSYILVIDVQSFCEFSQMIRQFGYFCGMWLVVGSFHRMWLVDCSFCGTYLVVGSFLYISYICTRFLWIFSD